MSSSDHGCPAKHLLGLNRAGQRSLLILPTPTDFPAPRSNAPGRSRNILQSTHALSIQVKDGCPLSGRQLFADLRMGWMHQKSPSICSDVDRRGRTSRGEERVQQLAPPGGRPPMRPEAVDPIQDRRIAHRTQLSALGAQRHQGVGTETRVGFARSAHPVRLSGLSTAWAESHLFVNALTNRSASKGVWFLSMK